MDATYLQATIGPLLATGLAEVTAALKRAQARAGDAAKVAAPEAPPAEAAPAEAKDGVAATTAALEAAEIS